jgi:hypothetical protein
VTEAYDTIFDVSAPLAAICRVANGKSAKGATSGPFRASLSLRSLGSTEVFTNGAGGTRTHDLRFRKPPGPQVLQGVWAPLA